MMYIYKLPIKLLCSDKKQKICFRYFNKLKNKIYFIEFLKYLIYNYVKYINYEMHSCANFVLVYCKLTFFMQS